MEVKFKLTVLIFIIGVCYAIDTHYMYKSCNGSISLDKTLLLETSLSLSYPSLMNCYYTVTVTSPQTILVVTDLFDVEPPVNDVCVDYLNIHDGSNPSAPLINNKPLCGSSKPNNISTTGSSITFYFVTDNTAPFSGFSFIVTAVERAPCNSNQFQCTTGFCIDNTLKCDDYTQCDDASDESDCQVADSSTDQSDNTTLIVGLVVGITALVGLIVAIVVHVYKKNQWKKFLHQHLEDPDVWNASPSYPVTHKYYKTGRGNYNTLSNDNDNTVLHQNDILNNSEHAELS